MAPLYAAPAWLMPWGLALLCAGGAVNALAQTQTQAPAQATAPARPQAPSISVAALRTGAAAAARPTAAPSASVAEGWPPGLAALALATAQQAAQALAPADAQVKVSALPWDARLHLAPCTQTEAFLAPGQPAWGRTRVGLRCVEGRTGWTVFAPVQVQVWAPALVLREALPAGARLDGNLWIQQTVDWAAQPGAPMTDASAAAGRTLARPLAAGEALRETHLQAWQWFSSGATVQVVAAGAGFSISTDALALGHGVQGQPVRVRTEGGRVLVGRATGAARVEVAL